MTTNRQEMIQQGAGRNEPPVHFSKSLQKILKARVEFPVFKESAGEMCVHDARAAFAQQPVLIFLAEHRIKGRNSCAF